MAKAFAENEFELFRPIQDRLYQSDFDRFLEESEIDKASQSAAIPDTDV